MDTILPETNSAKKKKSGRALLQEIKVKEVILYYEYIHDLPI